MGNKLFFFTVILFTFISGQAAVSPAFGDGSFQNPFHIESLGNLYWIAADSSNWDKYYTQMNDIDAAETYNWFEGKGWKAIGNTNIRFTGKYNGKNHTVLNLNINRPEEDLVGLFGMIEDADIDSLKLINTNIAGHTFVGGIAAYNYVSFITTRRKFLQFFDACRSLNFLEKIKKCTELRRSHLDRMER